jgi:hypothetical protein
MYDPTFECVADDGGLGSAPTSQTQAYHMSKTQPRAAEWAMSKATFFSFFFHFIVVGGGYMLFGSHASGLSVTVDRKTMEQDGVAPTLIMTTGLQRPEVLWRPMPLLG